MGASLDLDQVQMPALLADQLIHQGERPPPDGKTGKCETGTILDNLGRLLQRDALAVIHVHLLEKKWLHCEAPQYFP